MDQFCSKCGTALPPESQFCPKCGAAIGAPAVAPARAPATAKRRPKSTVVMWIPIAIIAIALLAWAVLSGLPFGEPDRSPRPQSQVEVVQEGVAPAPAPETEPEIAPEIRTPYVPTPSVRTPPVRTPSVQTPSVQTPPARTPSVRTPSVELTPPVPLQRVETAAPPAAVQERMIKEPEAIARLRSYITSRDAYGVSSDCLVVSSQGYKNQGYTLEAFDRCDRDSVGRWRVDALTGAVFRQRPDGRFLKP